MSLHEVQKAREAYEELKSQIKEQHLYNCFKTVLDAHPEIKTIRWSQYTPYFNDGDECIFSVNDPEFQFEAEFILPVVNSEMSEDQSMSLEEYEEDEDEFWYTNYDMNSWGNSPLSTRQQALNKFLPAYQELQQLLYENEDIFRHVFGDHAQVYVTRTGFDVEVYDHE